MRPRMGELSAFLYTMKRPGHENDRAFYCEAWNGTGAYTYDRIGRGTLHIRAACLSVLGGIQPGPLERYLREVFAGAAMTGCSSASNWRVAPPPPPPVDPSPDPHPPTPSLQPF